MALSNLGCFPLSQGEVLLFGGIANGAKQSWGKVMMVMGGNQHSFLPGSIDLNKGDVFANTTQVTVLNKGQEQFALIQGREAVHRLTLTTPVERSFTIEFDMLY